MGPVCSTNNPQPCLVPPKSECHDWQTRIDEMGKLFPEKLLYFSVFIQTTKKRPNSSFKKRTRN